MNYDNSSVRRRDRQLDEASARRLLKEAEYGVLCMQALHGGGYGVPLHFVWDGADGVYLHCAREGYKLECLAAEPRACLVITGKSRILPNAFSTEYESLLLHGEVSAVTNEEERHVALHSFLDKYVPESGERGQHFLHHAAARTMVLRFRILSASGKTNRGKES
ncbi:MAG: pyridoxamine 5'-phosphate oxidase family protein [Akkermansia sp.]|nr:pyridoxamine 5'-phosphate oxidase family protein [Akkermansia sp.]